MARRARRAGWDGTRQYGATVRRAWQRYARDLLRALDEMGIAADEPTTQAELDVLLSRLRRIAAGRYVEGEAIEAAGRPSARAALAAALQGLRRAGMPPEIEAQLLAPTTPLEVIGGARTRGQGFVTVSPARALGVIAPEGQGLLRAWGEEGASLILGAQEAVVQRIGDRAAELVATGQRWEVMQDLVAGSIEATTARVELIARDQVAKVGSQLTEELHRRAGVQEYRWRASTDDRTRPVHAEADGQVVSWLSEGYPGAGFYDTPAHAGRGGQCRCTAEPVPPESWGAWAQRPNRANRAQPRMDALQAAELVLRWVA